MWRWRRVHTVSARRITGERSAVGSSFVCCPCCSYDVDQDARKVVEDVCGASDSAFRASRVHVSI